MKKEIITATIIGIVLGFTITGLFWAQKNGKINLTSKKEVATKEETITSPSPVPTAVKTEEEKSIPLKIEEPTNETIVNKEKITIKGSTLPKATIVIIWEEGEDILLADEDGNFNADITLVSGENLIEITAYDDNGNQNSQNLTVTYSTAKI